MHSTEVISVRSKHSRSFCAEKGKIGAMGVIKPKSDPPTELNITVGDNVPIIYDNKEIFVPINLINLEVGTHEVRLCLRYPAYNDSCEVVSVDVVGGYTYNYLFIYLFTVIYVAHFPYFNAQMRCTGYEMARYKGTQASHLYEK